MRIVIVEDELQIRNGLSDLVERIHPEYHVVGCAGNGLDGLNCIKELRPDVVITDVRMPEMDGLEMIGALSAAGITTKYIIVSAYSEFSYAKKAMSYGATEYLLKPISITELTRSLKKVEMQLQASSYRDNIDSLEAAIRMLVLKGDREDVLRQIEAKYGQEAHGPFTGILFYYGDRYMGDSIGHEIYAKLQSACRQICVIPFEKQQSILCVLAGIEDKEQFAAWLAGCVKIYGRTLWMNADIFLAFCEELASIYPTAMELLGSMHWRISLPDAPLIRCPEVLHTQTELCAFPIHIENQLRIAVCSQSVERIQQQVRKFKAYFSGERVYAPQEIKECYTRFLWTAASLAKEVGILSANHPGPNQMVEGILSALTLRELNAAADKLLADICSAVGSTAQQESNITILRAKSLIHEFYSTGITLEEIARKLNITPEYLSTQFRKETGETFSVYIRNYRIGKAKELLIGTQLKLHQIAAQVGYADPKYFSQVFKKCTGQLPAEYRRTKK